MKNQSHLERKAVDAVGDNEEGDCLLLVAALHERDGEEPAGLHNGNGQRRAENKITSVKIFKT